MKTQTRLGGNSAKLRSFRRRNTAERVLGPLPNYSLSSVCPACGRKTYRQACKARCPSCGFMWDCSEL
ncbi:MAG: hypothetical protein OXI77_18825 [Chloroflexota bacterium]|nr:hypothetical protein [Chloroflexota bacterium]MDE2908555.1 hypothetical protein [Chloroflexota bacterium]